MRFEDMRVFSVTGGEPCLGSQEELDVGVGGPAGVLSVAGQPTHRYKGIGREILIDRKLNS
jgi:hypothetical protein